MSTQVVISTRRLRLRTWRRGDWKLFDSKLKIINEKIEAKLNQRVLLCYELKLLYKKKGVIGILSR